MSLQKNYVILRNNWKKSLFTILCQVKETFIFSKINMINLTNLSYTTWQEN